MQHYRVQIFSQWRSRFIHSQNLSMVLLGVQKMGICCCYNRWILFIGALFCFSTISHVGRACYPQWHSAGEIRGNCARETASAQPDTLHFLNRYSSTSSFLPLSSIFPNLSGEYECCCLVCENMPFLGNLLKV